MRHFIPKAKPQTISIPVILGFCLVGLIWLGGCNPRGVPGSALLPLTGVQTYTIQSTPSATLSVPGEETTSLLTPGPLAPDSAGLTSAPASPTATATLSATPNPKATKTRYPTKTYPPTRTRRPSKTPTISLTPTPPWAFIRIARPGPLSKVGTPLDVQMGMSPGQDGKLYIDLIGEDGRFITRMTRDFRQYINQQIYTSVEIDFEIPGAAETARLVMSARDKFGRTIALSSLDLVLIQMGDDITTNPGFQQEPFIIRNLKPDAVVNGGVLHLEGVAHPLNSQPVIFELLNENGTVLATKIQQIDPPEGPLSHTPFTLDLNYSVSASTHALLTMRQVSDGRIPGTIVLSSIPIQLQP
jgi:hypothetical protein